ncbi:MAG: DNA polymerase III subunit gamma/tau [Acidimicrobiia bacterium]
MSYQSLYRKYRPQRFDELVGQEHVVGALRNAVRDDRVVHAYFFWGPRGTGKTTTARILAKALNCTDRGADGEPCGECTSCREITAGSSLDVVEIDAASNNGVDEIRDLIERVAYRSAAGGRKVYIVDEVHELSARASNAFLKTLEEAPDHVVFVLATTNPEKVLPTIQSRTQPLEFTLLTSAQIVDHLADVAAREGVEADREALAIIARRGAGSLRDSLSLLDQALAQSPDRVDAAQVAALFGGTPLEASLEVLRSADAEDVAGALAALANLFDTGHDPRRVADDLMRSLRDALLLTAAGGRVKISAPDEERAALAALGEAMGTGAMVRALETLGQAAVDMRGTGAPDPRLVLEVAVVRLSRRDASSSLHALAERVDRLEQAVGGTGSVASGGPRGSTATSEAVHPADTPLSHEEPAEHPSSGPARALGALRKKVAATPDPSPDASAAPAARAAEPAEPAPRNEPARPVGSPRPPEAAAPPAGPVDLDDLIVAWAELLPTLSPATRAAVQEAQPIAVEGDVVVFGVPARLLEAARPRFRKEAAVIRTALADRVGRTLRFQTVAHDFGGSADVPVRPSSRASATAASDGPPPPEEPPDVDLESFDPDELVDAPSDAGAVDSVSRLVQTFGASVVEERPR